MSNKIKKDSGVLMMIVSSIMVLMLVCYLGINNVGDTYSASTCTYNSQNECHSDGWHCTENETTGCWEKKLVCYPQGQAQCQKATGYECTQFYSGCGYVQSGKSLGTELNCQTGNFEGTCGSSTIKVCGLSGTWTCTTGGVEYTYTCTSDSGSQTGADGSYSTCTKKSSSSSSTTKPSSSSSSTTKPSSSSSSSSITKPSSSSSSQEVIQNPQTGSIALFLVWIIGIGMVIYSFIYFKESKFE